MTTKTNTPPTAAEQIRQMLELTAEWNTFDANALLELRREVRQHFVDAAAAARKPDDVRNAFIVRDRALARMMTELLGDDFDALIREAWEETDSD